VNKNESRKLMSTQVAGEAHRRERPIVGGDDGKRAGFAQRLQELAQRVQASANFDELLLEQSPEICDLFNVERFTLYTVSEDRSSIVAKVKTGLASFKDLKLPISETSVAGYAAYHRKPVHIGDVYDERELKQHAPRLHFLKEVDRRTGYRTKQMLVAPVLSAEDPNQVIGVVQLINTRNDRPFPDPSVEAVQDLAKALAPGLQNRQSVHAVGSKYDGLVANHVISSGELELAVRTARRKSKDIEAVLIEGFQVKPAALGKALSDFFGVDYEHYKPDRIKPLDLVRNIKREYAETNQWLPVEENPDGLIIVSLDPERLRASHVAKNVFPRHKLIYRVTTQQEYVQLLDQFFGATGAAEGDISDMLAGMDDDGTTEDGITADELSAASENELVKLVNKIIVDAHRQGASDIHIEPYPGKNKTEIRFRKDGSLHPYIEVPASYRNPLVTRIKIMCDLDISERRKPQDGKIKFKKFAPLDIELRVATIPSAGGMEDVVMRILAAGEPLPLEKLALSQRNLDALQSIVKKPYGLFFVCGPTGSGKTTTLHSALRYINTSETKIWTAEDPVEITQKGLRQVQMNPKAGLTFATAMRAFLRADPDVIMVGEMRDKETVATGIEASLTGHLVFSTLHTNSATESITRLLDMGMDPFNFADALLGVLAQRLAKRLCVKCKRAYTPAADEIKRLISEYCEELMNLPDWKKDPQASYKTIYDEWLKSFANERGEFTLYKAVGCDTCDGTGYKGRVGLHELLVGSDAIKKNIQEHARVAEMLVTALSEGMRTLKQDGIEKVIQGITDIAQVRAVCIK
jgi:type II secretory ATPase GspE/PulE/Tfp pilus assembly ATPase PilB-like protein